MATKTKESRQRARPVHPVILFVIGVTAGLISASFPRVMTFMSLGDGAVDVRLFSSGYLFAAGIFAFTIGVSMVWLYLGSRESTQHLFLAALALPAVLSGGLNMSSSVSTGKATIQRLADEKVRLENKITNLNGIVEGELTFDDKPTGTPSSGVRLDGVLPSMLGISIANAAEPRQAATRDYNPGVQYSIKSEQKDYVISLFASSSKAQVEQKQKEYGSKLGPTNLEIRKAGDSYYLVTKERTNRTDAVLEAVEIRKQLTVTPSILLVK